MTNLNIFKRKEKQPKSLYTLEEVLEIGELLHKPQTKEVEKRLFELQQIQVAREVRIIEGKTTEQDAKDGMTRKEFPWLAKFNY